MTNRSAAAVFVALLACVALYLRAATEDERPFYYPDSFHYAEMGRQVARGEGFTSLQTYPYVLAWMQANQVPIEPPWPNVARFPLITAIYGPAFALLGATESVALLVGGLFFVATALATLALGARLFGLGVGLVAATACTVHVNQLSFARSGLLETPAAFFIVVTTLLLARLVEAPRDSGRGSRRALAMVAVGLVFGLAFLLRYDLVALTVAAVVVLVVVRRGDGARDAALLVLGAAVPVGAWWLHNLVAVGSPFVFLGVDRNVLGSQVGVDPYSRATYEGVWRTLARRPEILTAKLADVLWPVREWREIFGVHMALLGPLFLLAVACLAARRSTALPAATFVLVAFVVRVAVFTVTHHERRFYISFVPVLLVLAIGGLWQTVAPLLRPATCRRVATGTTAVVLLLLLSGWVWREIDAHSYLPPTFSARPEDVYDRIRERTPPRAVFASHWPEQIAWYAERPAVGTEARHLPRIERLGLQLDGLLFPTRDRPIVQQLLRWRTERNPFVVVYSDASDTLWLRAALARAFLAGEAGVAARQESSAGR
jgi:4-amino-4-deoxy-L-arabinose transferase-like glycosyltransferase